MIFPSVERVIYEKNPLDKVICQLRFAPILKIDAEIPAAFQERVRGEYPNLSEAAEWNLEAPSKVEGLPDEAIKRVLQSPGIRNYEFSSEDKHWKINLTRYFIALTTNKYRRWEEFRERLHFPLRALSEIYSPEKFSRIGLRYFDVITRSRLGLQDARWDELIQPYLLGILGLPEFRDGVQGFECTHTIRLDGDAATRIACRTVRAMDTGETCFVIDSDFFTTSRLTADKTLEQLDYFNNQASRLIRWCIKPRLHEVMEPHKV